MTMFLKNHEVDRIVGWDNAGLRLSRIIITEDTGASRIVGVDIRGLGNNQDN